MSALPAHLPAHISAGTTPTADDHTGMVCLEAAGQGCYGAFAEAAPNDEVRAVFDKNGQEELGHAHRVSRALKLLYDSRLRLARAGGQPLLRPAQRRRVVQGDDRGHRQERACRGRPL